MYEHKTVIGDGLISAEQLDRMDGDGWELLQILPYFEGIDAIKPGEFAFYFRRATGLVQ